MVLIDHRLGRPSPVHTFPHLQRNQSTTRASLRHRKRFLPICLLLLVPHPLNPIPDTSCTIAAISDEFFHLLEFYVHNDAPLTCRIPTHPLLSATGTSAIPASTTIAEDYIPLIFALAGTLQSSHLHINTRMNVILHTSPDLAKEEADILAATAYSVPSLSGNSTKIIIGDPLSLQLKVKWYTTPSLPPSTTQLSGLGGHVHFSTVVYCLLSAGVGVAGSLAYFRGVELPRRMRRYGKDRVGGGGGERGYAFPGSGALRMNGYGGSGKRD